MKRNVIKKAFCFFLMLLMLPTMAASAEQEYYTIEELKEQVAELYSDGWHETIQTKWRTIEINTPVIVPDAKNFQFLPFEKRITI